MDVVGPIDPELTGLSHPAPARATPFLVDGGRLGIRGIESRPGFTVSRGTTPVVSVHVRGLGTAANVLLFPGVARRDFITGHGSCIETLLGASTLPLVVAEWRLGSGRLPERVVVELMGPGGEVARDEPSGIVIARGEAGLGLALSPGSGSRHVEGGGAERLRVVLDPAETSGRLSIALAVGGSDEIRRGLAAARHANAHAVRVAAGPESGLLLRTGVPEIDDGFRWLRTRVAGQIRRHVGDDVGDPDVGGKRLLDLGIAAVGVGDRKSAESLLSGPPGRSPHRTLLAARFASVFGDARPASTSAGRWASLRAEGVDPAKGALSRLALEELTEALHGRADPGTLAALRRLGTEIARTPTGSSGERRLPMAGSGGAEAAAVRWLARLLQGNPISPAPSHARRAITDARVATAGFVSDPDEAWSRWRRLLAEPMEGSGPSLIWDPGDLEPELPASDASGSLAAELLLAVPYGILGLRPDAATGRIRIAPRMPAHVTSFEAGGLHVGTSRIRLRYTASDGVLRYELSPEAAAVPPLVVLEPRVPGEVRSTRIDGEAAELDLRETTERDAAGGVEGWTVVPVHLPLDGIRTLEIETTG